MQNHCGILELFKLSVTLLWHTFKKHYISQFFLYFIQKYHCRMFGESLWSPTSFRTVQISSCNICYCAISKQQLRIILSLTSGTMVRALSLPSRLACLRVKMALCRICLFQICKARLWVACLLLCPPPPHPPHLQRATAGGCVCTLGCTFFGTRTLTLPWPGEDSLFTSASNRRVLSEILLTAVIIGCRRLQL